MIVDAHTHIWQAVADHPQPDVTTVSPVCDVPLELLARHMDDHGVDRAVLVQPLFPGEDNSLVAASAAARPDRFAAVAVVDPRPAAAADALEHWVTRHGCRGLRLRPRVPAEDACFCTPATAELWDRARALGVVINLLASPPHLPRLAGWLDQYADVDVIIDHFAHPEMAEAAAPGAAGLEPLLGLARFPRVHVKVSGYYYFSQQPWPYMDCHALNRRVYDRFGPQRLIWGSDFPHVLLKCGYRGAVQLEQHHWSWLPADERAAIWGGNAARLYWPAA